MSNPLDTGAQADGEHVLQRPVDEQRIPKNTGASILDPPLTSREARASTSLLADILMTNFKMSKRIKEA
jgi:hypothetical protein